MDVNRFEDGRGWLQWVWFRALIESGRLAVELLESILEEVHRRSIPDRWDWGLKASKLFSVRSQYQALTKEFNRSDMELTLRRVIADVWKVFVPSKVGTFGWRLLLGRLPTRDALLNRGVHLGDHERSCSMCLNRMIQFHTLGKGKDVTQ